MTRWILWVALLSGCGAVRQIPDPERLVPRNTMPVSQANSHYLRGRLALLGGDLDGAASSFSIARVFDPASPWIALAQGEVALVRGDVDGAATAWEEATRIGPECSAAWMHRARVERLRGNAVLAASHYARAYTLGREWQALAGEFDVWLHAGQRDRATQVLADWTAQGALEPRVAAERGGRRLRMGDPEGAAKDLLLMVQERPENKEVVRRWVAAVLLCKSGASALTQLDRLREWAPEAVALLWATAVLADAAGDSGRVAAALSAWTTLAPADEDLQDLRRLLSEGEQR